MKIQSTDTNTDINLVLELSDKDVKATIIKLIQKAKTNSLHANKYTENLRKGMKNIKKYHIIESRKIP